MDYSPVKNNRRLLHSWSFGSENWTSLFHTEVQKCAPFYQSKFVICSFSLMFSSPFLPRNKAYRPVSIWTSVHFRDWKRLLNGKTKNGTTVVRFAAEKNWNLRSRLQSLPLKRPWSWANCENGTVRDYNNPRPRFVLQLVRHKNGLAVRFMLSEAVPFASPLSQFKEFYRCSDR